MGITCSADPARPHPSSGYSTLSPGSHLSKGRDKICMDWAGWLSCVEMGFLQGTLGPLSPMKALGGTGCLCVQAHIVSARIQGYKVGMLDMAERQLVSSLLRMLNGHTHTPLEIFRDSQPSPFVV